MADPTISESILRPSALPPARKSLLQPRQRYRCLPGLLAYLHDLLGLAARAVDAVGGGLGEFRHGSAFLDLAERAR